MRVYLINDFSSQGIDGRGLLGILDEETYFKHKEFINKNWFTVRKWELNEMTIEGRCDFCKSSILISIENVSQKYFCPNCEGLKITKINN